MHRGEGAGILSEDIFAALPQPHVEPKAIHGVDDATHPQFLEEDAPSRHHVEHPYCILFEDISVALSQPHESRHSALHGVNHRYVVFDDLHVLGSPHPTPPTHGWVDIQPPPRHCTAHGWVDVQPPPGLIFTFLPLIPALRTGLSIFKPSGLIRLHLRASHGVLLWHGGGLGVGQKKSAQRNVRGLI